MASEEKDTDAKDDFKAPDLSNEAPLDLGYRGTYAKSTTKFTDEKPPEDYVTYGPYKEINQKWDTMPLFAPFDDDNEDFSALKSIADESPPFERAEAYKEAGNTAYKLGVQKRHEQHFKDAVVYYKRALKQTHLIGGSPELDSSLYSNLAMVHIKLENYGNCIECCRWAVRCSAAIPEPEELARLTPLEKEQAMLNPKHVKIYYRAALGCLKLRRWDDGMDWVSAGFKKFGNSTELDKLEDDLLKGKVYEKHEQEELERKEKERLERDEQDLQALLKSITEHKIIMGRDVFRTGSMYPCLTRLHKGKLQFSVLFLYPEPAESDLIKYAGLDTQLGAHLAEMFPPKGQSPSWDAKGDHTASNLGIYVVYEHRMTKVNPQKTLRQVVTAPGYVVPRMPVFHVIRQGSPYFKTFVASYQKGYSGGTKSKQNK